MQAPEQAEQSGWTDTAFRLLLAFSVAIGPAYAVHLGRVGPVLPSVVLSALVLLLAVPVLRERGGRWLRLVLVLALGLGIPVHYASTGHLIQALALPYQDAALYDIDASLLGWLFPDGQMSVWIDRSSILGPATGIGRVLTEVFQVFYFSYYAWGFGLLVLLCVRFAKAPAARSWRPVTMFLCAWYGAYLLNFVLYLLVPAMGPWAEYPQLYEHELTGLWLTPSIRELVSTNQVTPDCFPSGHTALSWIAAICALRFAPRYGRVALVAAILITLATVGLRYHYAVDVLSAVPLILVGLVWGGFVPRRGE